MKFRQTFNINHNGEAQALGFPYELPKRSKLRVTSPSGKLHAVVTLKNELAIAIEIFDSSRRIQHYDGSQIHGQIYTHGPFAGVSWAPCETKLAFVAEKFQPSATNQSYYSYDYHLPSSGNSKNSSISSSTGESQAPVRSASTSPPQQAANANRLGKEFEFQEDFGEEMNGMRNPRVFVLFLDTAQVCLYVLCYM